MRQKKGSKKFKVIAVIALLLVAGLASLGFMKTEVTSMAVEKKIPLSDLLKAS